jgi:hypothetical protein
MHLTSLISIARMSEEPTNFDYPMLDLLTDIFVLSQSMKARRIVLKMSTVGKDEAKAILRRFQVWRGRQYS